MIETLSTSLSNNTTRVHVYVRRSNICELCRYERPIIIQKVNESVIQKVKHLHTPTPTSQQVDQDVESPKYNHRNSLPVRSNARTLVTLRNRPFTQSLVLNPPNTIIETLSLSLSLSLYLSKQLRTQYTSRRSNSVTLRPFKKSRICTHTPTPTSSKLSTSRTTTKT